MGEDLRSRDGCPPASGRSGRRQVRGLCRLGVVAVAALAALGPVGILTASPAEARDAKCTHHTLSRDKAFSAYVFRSGVGLVTWRDYMSINAYDLCNHGALSVTVSFSDAAVRAKGGFVGIGSVRFQASGSTTWRYLHRGSSLGTSTGYTVTYGDGGHVDLTSATRITKVQVNTYLNFGGDVYAPRAYTCDLVQRTCA